MPAVGIGISPFFGGLTPSEAVAYYTRVKAGGGTIDDFSALVGLTLDYKRIASLNPSLYTFASGRKAGTQYSLIPTDGSGDFSVTRSGTTGMELNAQGYWQPVGENVPRYDYVSGVPMINIEEARTNLIARYKSFAHSDWTKSGASIQGDPSTAGAELVVNGGFDTDINNWTATLGSAEWSSGAILLTGNESGVRVVQQVTTIVGKIYQVVFSRLGGNSVTSGIRMTNNSDGSVDAFNRQITSTESTFTGLSVSFVANSTTTYIALLGAVSATTIIDNVSVKEVTGYASPFVDANGANLMDGYKLVEDTSNGEHYIRPSNSILFSTVAYSQTIYAKSYERTWLRIGISNTISGGASFQNSWFDLSIGELGTIASNITASIEKNNITGWCKIVLKYTSILSGSSANFIYLYPTTGNNNTSYQGDGTSGVLIAHAQLEAGATASSPIGGAEGSSQTRNADVIVKTGASALIGQTEGYAVVEVNISKLYSAGRYLLALYNNLSSVVSSVRLYFPFSNRIDLSVFNSSGVESNLLSKTISSTGTYKIGIAWKDNDCVLVVNSEIITATTSGALGVSNLSNIVIGANRVTTELFNDRIKLIHLGKTRISNAQLQALTTL